MMFVQDVDVMNVNDIYEGWGWLDWSGKEMEEKAKRDVESIREGARQAMENELNHAKKQLQRETAKAAVELAEELIKKNINQQDQQQLFANFTKAVEESSHV